MTPDPPNGLALIVGESETSNEILRHILELEGWRVLLARSGGEALAMGLHTSPDLVITDVEMRRMDGLELARALNGREQPTTILALTPRPDAVASPNPFEAVLRKPVSVPALRRWVAARKPGGSGES